VRYQIFYITLQ